MSINQLGPESIGSQSVLRVDSSDIYPEGLLGLRDTIIVEGHISVQGSPIDYTLEVPENRHVEGLGYIAPGFGGIKVSSDPLRSELAQAGLATVSYSPGRKGETIFSDALCSQDLHAETLKGISNDISEHSLMIQRAVPGDQKLDPFHKILIPHSMGGLAVPLHALKMPSQTEMIINLASAGYGSPSLLKRAYKLARGMPGGVRYELIPFTNNETLSDAKDKLFTVAHYYGSNPFRTLGEFKDCLRADVRPAVAQLGALGVKTAYYAFQYDILVPPNEKKGEAVDYYEELPGLGHLGPQVKPRLIARKVMDFVQNPNQKGINSLTA